MEIIVEVLFEALGEFLLQIFGEILFESGFHSVLEIRKTKKERNPITAALGYLFLGALTGVISLLFFPESLIPVEYKFFNLVLTPILAGFIMALMGRWREKRGQEIIRLDKFSFGFLFAFSMALVRFICTSIH